MKELPKKGVETQKPPETEIDKALKIKEEYNEYKKQYAD